MKNSPLFFYGQAQRRFVVALCACISLAGAQALLAEGQAGIAAEEENFQNWVNFTIGGLALSGDHGQASQQLGISDRLAYGIQDMHWEQSLSKDLTLKLDGHALVGNEDYLAKMMLEKTDVGYFSAGYSSYRVWYDGNGGFYSPTGAFYPPQAGNVLAVDRGRIFAEIGLRVPDLPQVTFRYERDSRHGDKDAYPSHAIAKRSLRKRANAHNGKNLS